ncbi:2-hydroxymuconate tautomerase (plasmid) [Vibrio sp. THAF191c]|nr:2-hydroxymuconate tautomerase [Vibrio sp. THAF64]QGM37885.1 2-hydroxymuconate tautomerase [Vibrio sp. THAF191d]QGN73228.1 2-hydroxymuconate tautomerase [Vibrio sp. THAF191c]
MMGACPFSELAIIKETCMPVVTIQQSPGRSKAQKQLLLQRITEAFEEAYGTAPEAVTVFFQNFDEEHWGKGGQLHADRATSPQSNVKT